MLGFKNFLMEEDGVGVVEMLLMSSVLCLNFYMQERAEKYIIFRMKIQLRQLLRLREFAQK